MTRQAIAGRDALTLAAYALAVGIVLLVIQQCTAERIRTNQLRVLTSTLNQVIPASGYDNNPLTDKIDIADNNYTRTVYRALLGNQPAAAAVTAVAPDGYSGNIDLLIGISFNGDIIGVRVLSHRETPGLGDEIEHSKSDWIMTFDGKSKKDELTWTVRKDGGDFDQFTGATITPRAVIRAVEQTLEWYAQHRQTIFESL